jgi:hypothetical protein
MVWEWVYDMRKVVFGQGRVIYTIRPGEAAVGKEDKTGQSKSRQHKIVKTR